MKRRSLIAWMVLCLMICSAAPAAAQVFGGRVAIRREVPRWYGPIQPEPRRAPTYEEYYHYMNSHFPKYYGGFHASYFQSIGVPPGDIGLRGNGIFPTPW